MYCRGFSFDLVTRVWDVFFSEGYKIVYRVALALVKVILSDIILFGTSFISFEPSLYSTPLCTSALLHFCTSALLYFCTSVLLHFCTSALLHFCTSALLHFCTSALLYFCTSVLLYFTLFALLSSLLLYSTSLDSTPLFTFTLLYSALLCGMQSCTYIAWLHCALR